MPLTDHRSRIVHAPDLHAPDLHAPDLHAPDLSVPDAPDASTAGLRFIGALAEDALLLAWEWPEAVPGDRLRMTVDGRPAAAPSAAVQAPRAEGGMRVFAALKRPEAPCDIVFAQPGGPTRCTLRHDGSAVPLGPLALLGAGLNPAGRLRLVNFLLQFCAPRFHAEGDAAFLSLCRAVIGRPQRGEAFVAQVALTAHQRLYAGPGLDRIGRPVAMLSLSADRLHRAPVAPRRIVTPAGPQTLLAAAAETEETTVMVALGADDYAVLPLVGRPALPRLTELLRRTGPGMPSGLPSQEACRYAFDALQALKADPAAAGVLREHQLMQPQPPAALRSPRLPVTGEVEVAIGHGAGGLFLSGWLKDPYRLVREIEVVSAFGTRRPLDGPMHRLPRPDLGPDLLAHGLGGADPRPGFVAFLPGEEPAPVYQHRVELVLASGSRLALVPPIQPADPATCKAAVLGSVPAPLVTDAMLETCIAPAVASLHARHMATRGEPEVTRYGTLPGVPPVSVIVPLYRNLDFLRFQIAAFACDPDFAGAELIVVLDSPEQAPEVRHLLHGLHLVYGLPMRLAVHEANYGYGPANATGVELAQGDDLLFLNSDVIPDRPGWLGGLRAALHAGDVAGGGLTGGGLTGAVGPKLLFEDDSVQHAGLCFAPGPHGRWINQHHYKGYPRDFPPANRPRSVPGVTGACLLVRRAAYEAVGGFSADYVIGDYEDSDLCLKLRAAGYDIRYVPSVELYHLERRSIQQHLGYTRSLACEHNGWLHHHRWADAIAALAAAEERGEALGAGIPSPS